MGQPTDRSEVVSRWTTGYNYWNAKLSGDKSAEMYPDNPCSGFFRRAIREQKPSGQWHRVGWEPVAVFSLDGTLTGRVGDRDITGPDLLKLWEYCGGNAISEEWYRAVAERDEPWPDAHDPSKNKTPETVAVRDQNVKIETGTIYGPSPGPELIAEITQARAGVSQYDKIESDEMAGRALSLKNELTTLAGKMDKAREALVRPHIDAQTEINGRFNPIIKDAKTEGAKLMQRIGVWEDTKRIAAREAQARADREAREHAEKVRKAEEAGKPAPAAPKPVAPNAPPPSTQVAAAVGRKASVKVAKVVTDINVAIVIDQFVTTPEIRELLMQLAQRAVNAGLEVRGATIEERSIVR
jgi:hypothetical protein